ncbi:MAG: sel1 repeat family protein [Candidatus Methanomethylophilaceae archaeon]|nr:sel1 repeat family protein [Candidatus Methanomethylophilaceae archaeon]
MTDKFAPSEAQVLHSEAEAYELGDGVEVDQKKAAELYQKAADLGFIPSMCRLGEMYMSGQGVERDHAKGRELFEKASELGDPEGASSSVSSIREDTVFRRMHLPH